MDTQRSFFVESGRYTTKYLRIRTRQGAGRAGPKYLRILRVSFVHPFDGRELAPTSPPLLAYVTFEPIMLSSGGIIGIPLFEKLSETMKRAMAWLNRTAPGQSAAHVAEVDWSGSYRGCCFLANYTIDRRQVRACNSKGGPAAPT